MKHLIAPAVLAVTPLAALAQGTLSVEGTSLYFIGLADGDTVDSPLTVRFGQSGMGVAPAEIEKANTGHHHLFVDRPPFGEGEFGDEEFELAIPNDANHRHFGSGQTEVTIELAPGSHTLQLVLGDHGHVPHDPAVVSDVITITVN